MHEALKKQPDAKQFKKAMVKEVKDHTERGHWKVIEKKDVPKGNKMDGQFFPLLYEAS